ncbi:nickel pincer cofactor biosynthesis protein LarB [Algibacillus agarilyticus]|uniref:nickel pincer cofactor biosynthesis protein LarB n=1 Tax=Algibacillus agarilyticus TaxID=2234133 RepID=UPI000DD0B2B9|nr:nickel pincer cofactor biosynthesis protein LarB [Algibacillus agarilyticus]
MQPFKWDAERKMRTGIAEAVYCSGKTVSQIEAILVFHLKQKTAVLLTRLTEATWQQIDSALCEIIDYDAASNTAIYQPNKDKNDTLQQGVLIVAAGTSDMALAQEAARTLNFNGFSAPIISDVGVAGLWRLMDNLEEIRQYALVIAVAGMEGALFSVLAGLIHAPVIALPSAVGYGVSADGQAALQSALASCSPGIVTVNIGNGFGAAVAAIKMMNMQENEQEVSKS